MCVVKCAVFVFVVFLSRKQSLFCHLDVSAFFAGQLNKPPFGKFESILGFKDCSGLKGGQSLLKIRKGTKKDIHGDTVVWIWLKGITTVTVLDLDGRSRRKDGVE